MSPSQLDRIATRLAGMNRPALMQLLRSLRCDFKIDFTDDYLHSVSLERLRHIVLAAELHAHHDAAGPAA